MCLGWLMVTTFFSVRLETFLLFVPLTNMSDPERVRHSKMGGDKEEREGGGSGEQEVPTQGSYVASHCFSDPIQTPSGPEPVRRVCAETVYRLCLVCVETVCVRSVHRGCLPPSPGHSSTADTDVSPDPSSATALSLTRGTVLHQFLNSKP